MSRLVLVIDSSTGAAIDVAGNKRETGRYAKFIKRMLSLDKNPSLNFGFNGGDTLTISKNGSDGELVNIKAKILNVSGTIKSNGQTLEQIASSQITPVLDMVYGTDGEIDVLKQIDESGNPYIQIILNESIVNRISELEQDVERQEEGAGSYVSKKELATAIEGISIEEEDGLEEVKDKFSMLLSNIAALVGDSSSSASGEG